MIPEPYTIQTVPIQIETKASDDHLASVQSALEVFHRDGIVIIPNAIHISALDALRGQMSKELPVLLSLPSVQYNQGKANLNVSQSPPLSRDFLFKEVWANERAVSVIENLLGPKPQLAYVGGNTALPKGHDRQSVHSDVQPPHPQFIYGVEANIYLSDVSAANGVTEFWPGTHHYSRAEHYVPGSHGWVKPEHLEERFRVSPPIQPTVPKGSIVLRDLRLWHSGMPNLSNDPRYMLGFVYFPAWFRSPMRITLPPDAKDLVQSWSKIGSGTTVRYADGPVDHLKLPFGLNLTQRADGDIRTLIMKTKTFVADYMKKFDLSHDYTHVLRVLNLAKRIRVREQLRNPSVCYDTKLITLASLLHDVGDHKYLEAGETGSEAVETFLLQTGATPELASKVQCIVTHVSYSAEIKDPAAVSRVLQELPELGIVQDADRLDATGAIGIGRCFIFAATKRAEDGMEGALKHFEEKLERLAQHMKTDTGRELARLRTKKLESFRAWWEEET
ncbi:MAG: hypothetical protein Q9161_009797, partial [Pseudevernia consocians]